MIGIAKSIDYDQDIVSVAFFDVKRKRLAFRGKQTGDRGNPMCRDNAIAGLQPFRHREFTSQSDGKRYISMCAPILSHINEIDLLALDAKGEKKTTVIGHLELVLSKEGITTQVNKYIFSTLLSSSLVALLGILLTVIVSKKITAPLKRLQKAARDVAKGELDHSLEIETRDEISDLAEDFQIMLEHLKRYRSQAWQRTEELVEANAAKTTEILERKKIAVTLKKSREMFASVLDSLDAIVYVADMDTYEILYVNKFTRERFGDIVGSKCWESLKQGQNEPCDYCTNKYLLDSTGTPKGVYVWEHQDPFTGRWFDLRDKAIRWIDGRIVRLEIGSDITTRKNMENEIAKIKNLESLGVLAGGIAHDFNNLMTGVLGYISLLRRGPASETERVDWLETAEGILMGARDLTAKLLTFSKGGLPSKAPCSIVDLIRDATEDCLSRVDVKCEYEIQEDLVDANVDKDQIGQVLQNLVINASEAMPEGGTITIRADNFVVATDKFSSLKKGTYIRIAVQDEGKGISGETLQNIFDPYFTTKDMGTKKGLGLGLAICHSIVRNHGGILTVASEENKGSVFTIYLPATEEPSEVFAAEESVFTAGTGKILVMDDEEIVRKVSLKMLERAGYAVEVASNGEKAIEIFSRAKDSGQPFDVIVADLTVPGGMGGKELVYRLSRTTPDLKAILSSGYTNDPAMTNYEAYGFLACIKKPYNIDQLSELLNSVLGESNKEDV